MRTANRKWKYPPAPREIPADAQVFLNLNNNGYCGALALPNSRSIHKFMLPGADSADGFYSDPIAARAALEKYLKEVGR